MPAKRKKAKRKGGKRSRLAIGIYRDKFGVSVRVGKKEARFALGTPLVILKNHRKQMLELHERHKTSGKATLTRDAAIYRKRKGHLVNLSSVDAELKAWCDLYGRKSRFALTRDDVLTARHLWLKQGKAPKTINNRETRLKALYHELDGPKAWTPCDGVAPLPVHRHPINRIPPQTVLDVLARMAERGSRKKDISKIRARLMVIASTGMRPSEVGRAQKGDVDLAQRVWVPRTGKGGWSPGIYLNDDMLAAWTAFVEADAWGAFDSSNFAARLRAYGWPAGLRPYHLRHSTGIALSEAGRDLDDISAHFGHKRRETTRRNYVPVLNSRMQKMSEAIEGRFGGFAVPQDGSTKTLKMGNASTQNGTLRRPAQRAKKAR